MIRQYKYNEFKYAETIYNEGFQDKKHLPTELKLLVMYYRIVLELKPKNRKIKLYEFCEKNIKGFNRVLYFKRINTALNKGGKKDEPFSIIEKMSVYKGEIEYIESLDVDYNCKKVLFTMLVNHKLTKTIYELKNSEEYKILSFKGDTARYNYIKQISNLPQDIKINDEIIRILNEKNVVSTRYKGLIRLNYIENCIEDGGVEIEVTDFENIGWTYDYYNEKENVMKCLKCGKIIKKNSNRKKYCIDCYGNNERERKRKKNWNKKSG